MSSLGGRPASACFAFAGSGTVRILRRVLAVVFVSPAPSSVRRTCRRSPSASARSSAMSTDGRR